jgi:hypothetical protein
VTVLHRCAHRAEAPAMLPPGRPHALEKWSAEKARVLATGFIRVLVKRPLTRIVSAWAGTGIRIAGGNWCGHGMKPMSAAGVCVSTIRSS